MQTFLYFSGKSIRQRSLGQLCCWFPGVGYTLFSTPLFPFILCYHACGEQEATEDVYLFCRFCFVLWCISLFVTIGILIGYYRDTAVFRYGCATHTHALMPAPSIRRHKNENSFFIVVEFLRLIYVCLFVLSCCGCPFGRYGNTEIIRRRHSVSPSKQAMFNQNERICRLCMSYSLFSSQSITYFLRMPS